MDFLQTLRAHRGGLLRLKRELFWYGKRGPDGSPGQVCLLLGAAAVWGADAGALLLIDGAPHWVWVAPEDVELIT